MQAKPAAPDASLLIFVSLFQTPTSSAISFNPLKVSQSTMADPLSVSASVAGLITIADIVVRNGYKYIRLFKDADKSVGSLVLAVNLLSGTLHSLRNIAERLDSDNTSIGFTTQIHHVEACYQTLRKIMDLLDKFELSKTKGFLQTTAQKLRWPLTSSETKGLDAKLGITS
jgi:hypothetical protein